MKKQTQVVVGDGKVGDWSGVVEVGGVEWKVSASVSEAKDKPVKGQDRVLVWSRGGVMAVAVLDGVAGMGGASGNVVEKATAGIATELKWLVGEGVAAPDVKQARGWVERVLNQVHELGRGVGGGAAVGLALLARKGEDWWWVVGHVGDVRGYKLDASEGGLEQVTLDDAPLAHALVTGFEGYYEEESMPGERLREAQRFIAGVGDVSKVAVDEAVGELYGKPVAAAAVMEYRKRSNVVGGVVGAREGLDVKVDEVSLRAGEWGLLLSDGIVDCLTDEQLAEQLVTGVGGELVVRKIIDLADKIEISEDKSTRGKDDDRGGVVVGRDARLF